MKNRGMTLAELVVVLALICILLLSIYSVYLIFLTSINFDTERYTISSQVSYALSDIKLRCLSASQINDDSRFDSTGDTRIVFNFTGERDIYTITPDDLTDDTTYSYYKRDNGDLVVEDGAGKVEVLVEGKYDPKVEFKYTEHDEPNYITVTITATGKRNFGNDVPKVTKIEGIRFWFVDVVR